MYSYAKYEETASRETGVSGHRPNGRPKTQCSSPTISGEGVRRRTKPQQVQAVPQIMTLHAQVTLHRPTVKIFCPALLIWTAILASVLSHPVIDHPRSGVAYNFGRVCLSVCLYVCLYVCQKITFESIDVGRSYLHMPCISMHYGSSSCMKVIGSMSRSQEPKGRIFLFPQCKPSTGSNSRSMKYRAVMFACSMRFSGTADRMV